MQQYAFGGEGFLYNGLGLGGEVSYVSWEGRAENTQAWVPALDFSYHFGRTARRGHGDPFVLGGFSPYLPASPGNRGQPAANVGGGINWWVRERAAIRLEVRT